MTGDRTFGTFFRRVLRRSSADSRNDSTLSDVGDTSRDGNGAETTDDMLHSSAHSKSGSSIVSPDISRHPSGSASSQVAFKPSSVRDLHGETSNTLRAPPDNASVMTIASSSKRRRRSLDTNASTRAVAAESILSHESAE